jgi:hypothetical protein
MTGIRVNNSGSFKQLPERLYLFVPLLMTVLSQSFFTLVRRNFMTLPFFTTRHTQIIFLILFIKISCSTLFFQRQDSRLYLSFSIGAIYIFQAFPVPGDRMLLFILSLIDICEHQYHFEVCWL